MKRPPNVATDDSSANQDNHYIPQFLLRGWCNRKGRLTVYSRQNGRVVTSVLNPRSTGFEPNLYAYEQVPPEHRHLIEREFMSARIDTPAALIVQKILDGEFPKVTADERSVFTRFLMSLRARHPDAVALAKLKGREELMAALARDPEEYLAIKENSSPPSLAEWARQNAPSVIPNFGISVVPKVIAHYSTGVHVFNMPWWTHDVRYAQTDLLLSDRPCLLEGDAMGGEAIIALPLSPTMLFFACNREHQIKVLRSMPVTRLVKMVNRASIIYAANRVYGTGSQHLPVVEKHLTR